MELNKKKSVTLTQKSNQYYFTTNMIERQAQVKVYQGRILVRAPFELKDKLKDIPTARWIPQYKCWSYSPTPTIAFRLDNLLGTYKSDKQFEDLLEQSFQQAEAQAAKSADDLPEIPCTKTPAWKHQKQAFWFVVNLWGGLPE
jgi:hypothetical protein